MKKRPARFTDIVCRQHPTYRGVGPVRGSCKDCSRIWMRAAGHRKWDPTVLVFKEKHGSLAYVARDWEERDRAALHVLTRRFREEYWYHDPSKEKVYSPVPSLTKDQVEGLPMGPVKAAAQLEWRNYESELRRREADITQYKAIQAAVSDKDGIAAWRLIQDRREYEYEGYDRLDIQNEDFE